jgi:putative PIN family toxin of toxin-antitoxin system
MIRAFVDTSVLIAASYSPTAASRELIRLAFQGQVQLVISDDVLEEARRNLATKLPEGLDLFEQIVELVPFETVVPSGTEVRAAATYTDRKDAPIVAAAKQTQVDYLTSLDRRHLVDAPEVAKGSGLKIVLPHELLKVIRRQSSIE